MIDLKGPRFGAFRGSVRFVANSADVTAVGGGHSASGMAVEAQCIVETRSDSLGLYAVHVECW